MKHSLETIITGYLYGTGNLTFEACEQKAACIVSLAKCNGWLAPEDAAKLATPAELKTASPWPLGINPDMDKHAASLGLGHWSCRSETSNTHWQRSDGRRHSCFQTIPASGSYMDELREVDLNHPLKWAIPA